MKDVQDGRCRPAIRGGRTMLAYGDDIVAMGETRENVMNTTSEILRANQAIRLRANRDRIENLMVARKMPNIDYIAVNN